VTKAANVAAVVSAVDTLYGVQAELGAGSWSVDTPLAAIVGGIEWKLVPADAAKAALRLLLEAAPEAEAAGCASVAAKEVVMAADWLTTERPLRAAAKLLGVDVDALAGFVEGQTAQRKPMGVVDGDAELGAA
jgi:hypothetical protein